MFYHVLPREKPRTTSHNQDILLHYFLDKAEIKGKKKETDSENHRLLGRSFRIGGVCKD